MHLDKLKKFKAFTCNLTTERSITRGVYSYLIGYINVDLLFIRWELP